MRKLMVLVALMIGLGQGGCQFLGVGEQGTRVRLRLTPISR